MARFLLSLCLAFWPATASFAQESVVIDLGPSDKVAELYSYPNNCAEVCVLPNQTLTGTIEKYLRDSLRREGYGKPTTVAVSESAGRVSVRLDGAGANDYANILPKYLDAGKLGLKGARELLTARDPEDGHILWRYNWRFFLPHGVAMAQHEVVQLLHFPPDNVLMAVQDYLAAQTTKRWAELLKKNGAAPEQVDRFQNIIDIAPIAAPHKDGGKLKHTYSHFDGYINALLDLFVPLPGQGGSRPMVAFGSEVRKWLQAAHHVDLGVGELGEVTLASGLKVPTLGANHPSFIWNAVNATPDNPSTSEDEALRMAMTIMQQDIIAACWEVKMGMNPTASPEAALSDCKQAWSGRDRELCELSYTQAFNKSSAVAGCLCSELGPQRIRALINSVSEAEFDALRNALGAFESAEPDSASP